MSSPVNRTLIIVLQDGTPVLDWGDGNAQDLLTGEFRSFKEGEYSHPIQDKELDVLKQTGRIKDYDSRQVYLLQMPEPPRRTID